MNSQVIGLLPPQAQNFAVRSTPLDVSDKPPGDVSPGITSRADPEAIAAEIPKQQHEVFPDELVDMLDKVNLSYDPFEIKAEFSMSEHGKRVIITLRNTRTGDIIRKIPPEDFTSRFEGSTGGLGLWINRKV